MVSVLFQVQQVMGHLLESKLQYYEPERFWRVFRLWGQSINVREQQDALDFFQALIDQLDEQITVSYKNSNFSDTHVYIMLDRIKSLVMYTSDLDWLVFSECCENYLINLVYGIWFRKIEESLR